MMLPVLKSSAKDTYGRHTNVNAKELPPKCIVHNALGLPKLQPHI